MKVIKKLGYLLSLVGVIMYLPPVMGFLKLHFGENIGHLSGIVSFAIGWAILGAHFAFSAGYKYQHERLQRNSSNILTFIEPEQKQENGGENL